MVFCVNCGNRINDENSKFCASCGYKISNETSQQDLINIGEGEDNGDEILLNNFISEVSSKLTDRAMNNLLKPVEFTSKDIYTHPNIPGKKIYNFMKFFNSKKDFEVKVYFDSTVFGKGDNGLAIVEYVDGTFLHMRNRKNECLTFNFKNDGNNEVEYYASERDGRYLLLFGEIMANEKPFVYVLNAFTDATVDELYSYLRQNMEINQALLKKHILNYG